MILKYVKFYRSLKINSQLNFSKPFATVYNPNSLMFHHKKDIEKIQKQKTRMASPRQMEKLDITLELDLEPGIYHLAGSTSIIKVCNSNKNNKCEINNNINQATPEDGFIQLYMPFDKDPNLKKKYRLLNYETMRYGKLLEILDYLSGFSVYRFNNIVPKSNNATVVTAGVDTIELFREVNINNPLVINTYPTFTGESSIEIRVDIYNGHEIDFDSEICSPDSSYIGSAYFVFVMRDPQKYSIKKRMASLVISDSQTDIEKEKAMLRQEIGLENRKVRIIKSKLSLFRSPPTQEETAILHEQFVIFKRNKNIILNESTMLDSYSNIKTIQETKVEKSIIMHSQYININGHVFGGFIMREALELSYVCAYMHSNKQKCLIISVDSVTFHKPVVIGSIALFISHITFIHEELLHVCVEVFNYIDSEVAPALTTTINITYKTQSKTPKVIATTYECGIKYLEAKRIFEKLFNIV